MKIKHLMLKTWVFFATFQTNIFLRPQKQIMRTIYYFIIIIIVPKCLAFSSFKNEIVHFIQKIFLIIFCEQNTFNSSTHKSFLCDNIQMLNICFHMKLKRELEPGLFKNWKRKYTREFIYSFHRRQKPRSLLKQQHLF